MNNKKMTKALFLPAIFTAALLVAGCGGSSPESGTGAAETTASESVAQTTGSVSATAGESSLTATTQEDETGKEFFVSQITDDIFARMEGKSFSSDCTVSRDDLRYIHVLHKDIDGKTHEGEMVCNKAIAYDLIDIFEELYEKSYPIEKMALVDEYGADDETSMRDNNSSCFNFRFISGTEEISMHGKGLAVDINPLYNPFVVEDEDGLYIEPDTAWDYVDRDESFDYKIEEDDLLVTLFKQHGFDWGGDWTYEKDYQHFEKDV